MAQYVMINRRAGKFTTEAKVASRATVADALQAIPGGDIVADHNPADELARRIVVFDANPDEVAAMRQGLSSDVMIEPLIRRSLHGHRRPMQFAKSLPTSNVTLAAARSASFSFTAKGSGKVLPNIEALIYLRDNSGGVRNQKVKTDAQGRASLVIPSGSVVAAVEPIPYAANWIMIADAPSSGAIVDCLAIPPAPANGGGWWHDAMGIDLGNAQRGNGIKVGVIDTGCGPHPNLAHVTLVGAFIDDSTLPPAQATDVAEHGTHTSGIIGARPTRPGDYAGMAPGCDLFHARVFKGEGPDDGPSQADIIRAIDALSRDNACDLINMSLGGGPKSGQEEDAILDALERGTLCICSAGNSANGINFPGAYSECAAVSAIGKVGWAPVGTFSAGNNPQDASKHGNNNMFLAAFSCFGDTLACTGPGVGIVSTVPDRNGFSGAYMEMDGTSMSSPAVCGTLAVILSGDENYKSLPRDRSRATAARTLLTQHCSTLGLPTKFEGRGIPVAEGPVS